ncbi:MAG: histidine kinase [Acidobacteria bacterium]|nr:histidine kinase [Acidobacteriota bacterium]
MSGLQGCAPDLWPALSILALLVFLGSYSWRRRNVRGATPFAFACLFGALWVVGAIGEISATDFAGKKFWVEYQAVCQLPTATAICCFVLAYAGLGRWLTRRNLSLLALPCVLVVVAVVSNDVHHLQWTAFRMDGHVVASLGTLGWAFVAYGSLLGVVNFLVLLWFAIRFPQHRWPAGIMLLGQIIGRGSFVLDKIYPGTLGPGGSVSLVVGVLAAAYALAFFGFHVFDPVPLARAKVIEQMQEGMLVLDTLGRIVDVNSAAGRMLAGPVADLRGRSAAEVLAVEPGPLIQADRAHLTHAEISRGAGPTLRHYTVNPTPLTDRRKRVLGHLVLLYDVTDQKRLDEQRIEQHRMAAVLQERESLARELHDGIGQVLGYVSMQAQTAAKWVQDGNPEKARTLLDRLAGVARDAHADVRESILNLRGTSPQDWALIPALREHLNAFQAHYGVRAELRVGEGVEENCFSPAAGVQILRVAHEALSNARKHGTAQAVNVSMERDAGHVGVTISDDGRGFDADMVKPGSDGHFGLLFMRERIEKVGGSLMVDSSAGSGTVVRICLPLRDRVEEST